MFLIFSSTGCNSKSTIICLFFFFTLQSYTNFYNYQIYFNFLFFKVIYFS
nr:MAG TPA: hypothetical protein [Caudoviricetes sp.]